MNKLEHNLKSFILNSGFNHTLWLEYLVYKDFFNLFKSDRQLGIYFKRCWPQKRAIIKDIKYINHKRVRYNSLDLQPFCVVCQHHQYLRHYSFYDITFFICQKSECLDTANQLVIPNFKCPFIIPNTNLWFKLEKHPFLKCITSTKNYHVLLGHYCGVCFRDVKDLPTINITVCQPKHTQVFKACCFNDEQFIKQHLKNKPFVIIKDSSLIACHSHISYYEDDDGKIREPFNIQFYKSPIVSSQPIAFQPFMLGYSSNYSHLEKEIVQQCYYGDQIKSQISFIFTTSAYDTTKNFFKCFIQQIRAQTLEHYERYNADAFQHGIDARGIDTLWHFQVEHEIICQELVEEIFRFKTLTPYQWDCGTYKELVLAFLQPKNIHGNFKYVYFKGLFHTPQSPFPLIANCEFFIDYQLNANEPRISGLFTDVGIYTFDINLEASEDEWDTQSNDSFSSDAL